MFFKTRVLTSGGKLCSCLDFSRCSSPVFCLPWVRALWAEAKKGRVPVGRAARGAAAWSLRGGFQPGGASRALNPEVKERPYIDGRLVGGLI